MAGFYTATFTAIQVPGKGNYLSNYWHRLTYINAIILSEKDVILLSKCNEILNVCAEISPRSGVPTW